MVKTTRRGLKSYNDIPQGFIRFQVRINHGKEKIKTALLRSVME
jgi:hypothetical protein